MCVQSENKKKAVQLSLLFGLGLESLSSNQNQLIFFVVMQHSNIYDLRCLCLVSIDIIFSSMCSTEVASTYGIKAKPSLVQDFWMNLKLESLNFTQYLFFFDGAGFELFPIFFEMSWFLFTVPVLLGNNQKTGLKWKQNLVSPNKYEYGAENLKDIWRFRYTISVNYVSFWKFKNRAGNKLKLRKRQSPSGIGRVGMSAFWCCFTDFHPMFHFYTP